MLEGDLAARVKVVGKLLSIGPISPIGPIDSANNVQLADKQPYETFVVPLIEKTPDLPAISGVFHDPEFARASFEFLSSKQAMTAGEYVELAQGMRSKAFTISGETNVELLTAVKDALAEVVKTGGTSADFKKAIDGAFQDFGVDALDPWRTRLVFDTNVAQAQGDGEWDELHQEGVLESFPFFRYRARMVNTRPAHAWMDGKVYASDDPIWEEWWPPNGFNCHCWIDYISRYEAESQGIVADTVRPWMPPDEGFGLGEKEAGPGT